MMRGFETVGVSMNAKLEVKNSSVHARFLHNRHIVLLHDDLSYRKWGWSLACDAIARPIVCQKNCIREWYIGSGNGIATCTDPDFGAAIVEISREHQIFFLICCLGRQIFAHPRQLQCVETVKCHLDRA